MVVAPGIVDPHTHYDPQLTFEPYGTSSLLPRRHHRRRRQLRLLGRARAPRRPGVAHPALRPRRGHGRQSARRASLEDFETFPEFLGVPRRQARHQHGLLHRPLRAPPLGDGRRRAGAGGDRRRDRRRCAASSPTPWPPAPPASRRARSPTHFDSHDRPIPSRLADGRRSWRRSSAPPAGPTAAGGRSPTSRTRPSAASPPDDEELLVRMSLDARLPVIIQGLGARSKVDAPTAGLGQRQAVPRRGHRRGRRRLLDGDVEAVQPHVHARRRARRCTRARSSSTACSPRRATVPERMALLRDRVVPRHHPAVGREPQPRRGEGPDAAAAALAGRVHVHRVSPPREREVRRPLARRHRRRARRAPDATR